MFDSYSRLPQTGMTVEEARRKLSGLHFAKEALSEGEREILHIAEALMRLVDADRAPLAEIAQGIENAGDCHVSLFDDCVEVYGDREVYASTRTATFKGIYSRKEIETLADGYARASFSDYRTTIPHHSRT